MLNEDTLQLIFTVIIAPALLLLLRELQLGRRHNETVDAKKIELSEKIAEGTGNGAPVVVNTAPAPPLEVVPATLTEDTGRALVRALENLAATQRGA